MNIRSLIVILEESFPKPTSFSTLEVIKVIRTKEKLSSAELSNSAVYRHMRNLLSERVIRVSLTRKNKAQERSTTYYTLVETKSNKGKPTSWWDNSVGVYLQRIFSNLGTKPQSNTNRRKT